MTSLRYDRVRRRVSRDDGSSPAIEIIGMLPLIILASLAAWQVLLVAWTATAAENAARVGSRVAVVEQSQSAGREAAYGALQPGLRSGAQVTFPDGGTRARVRVGIPVLHPALRSDGFAVARVAEMPPERD